MSDMYEDKIKKGFIDLGQTVTRYNENRSRGTVDITIGTSEITFEMLAMVSEAIGTASINFTGKEHEWRHSEYTGGTDYTGEIHCWNVKFD